MVTLSSYIGGVFYLGLLIVELQDDTLRKYSGFEDPYRRP